MIKKDQNRKKIPVKCTRMDGYDLGLIGRE
jgi:hypothetical protein